MYRSLANEPLDIRLLGRPLRVESYASLMERITDITSWVLGAAILSAREERFSWIRYPHHGSASTGNARGLYT